MDAVLRPVNDRFLNEVVFPVFEIGVRDAVPALEKLLESVHDERTRLLVETLLTKGVEGSFFTLDAEMWLESAYRLLFWEWIEASRGGWQISAEYTGFAGAIDETLHLALMLEDLKYPYWDAVKARQVRFKFFGRPTLDKPLAALLAGLWDPFPQFPPDQVIATRGRDPVYNEMEGTALADWSYRTAEVVSGWAEKLPGKLASLLRREADRLRPVPVPEQDEIYDFWMGRHEEPPLLTVAFSGLGRQATRWVRDIGGLARVLRSAAAFEQGLTSVIAPRGEEPGGLGEIDQY